MKHFLIILVTLLIGTFAYSQKQSTTYTRQNNADFAKSIATPNVQLVDVRTPAEYTAGHIPGAVNMDVTNATFDQQIATLDKKRPVAIYCRSGSRSKIAARKLVSLGFKVYELDKGITHWNGKIKK